MIIAADGRAISEWKQRFWLCFKMMVNDVWIAGTDHLCYKNSIMENRNTSAKLAGRRTGRMESGEREQEINLTCCAIV